MTKILRKAISDIGDILTEVEEIYEKTKEKQSQIDKLIVDLEHAIEFENYPAHKMMMKYKELRACFRLRRKYKNDMSCLLAVRPSLNKAQTIAADKILSDHVERIGRQTYSHRVSEEIRLEILKEAKKVL